MKNIINRDLVELDLNRHHVKYEDPLWDEYKETASKNRRIQLIDGKTQDLKDYSWEFTSNNRPIFTLYANDLSKKQINYILSSEGMQFMMACFKKGCESPNKMKALLIKKLKDSSET